MIWAPMHLGGALSDEVVEDSGRRVASLKDASERHVHLIGEVAEVCGDGESAEEEEEEGDDSDDDIVRDEVGVKAIDAGESGL